MRKAASRKASGNFASDLPLLEVSTGQEDGGTEGKPFLLVVGRVEEGKIVSVEIPESDSTGIRGLVVVTKIRERSVHRLRYG